MKPIDENSKVGWMVHSYGHIEPKVYFNHLSVMGKWSQKFKMVFLGLDKHRVADARNILVNKAREIKCTHILIIDTDHILPDHMLECLSLNNDAPVVSGLITKRYPPYYQVGFVRDKKGYQQVDIPCDGKSYSVDVPGMGCTLIDMDIFDTIEEPFFFDCVATRENGDKYNKRSDTNFFEKVRAAGHKIIIDSRVLVGHVGESEVIYPNTVPKYECLEKEEKELSNGDCNETKESL